MAMKTACLYLLISLALSAGTTGCGKSKPSNGKKTFQDQGSQREYFVHVPTGYNSDIPTPVVILFHGWGYSGAEWYSGSGLGAVSAVPTADANKFILIAPTGLTDSSLRGNCANGGGYCSWNGGGTTGSPGPLGMTCNPNKQKSDYCYRDTCKGGCRDICSWTTCNDDTTMVHNLLDLIETQLCVDTSRVYAGGESNGGVMTWQLGGDSRGARFAAFAPTIGLPHHGFSFRPSYVPMPIMGIWGSTDRTIPHGDMTSEYTESSDGWYYSAARYITRQWSDAHGCDVSSNPLPYSTVQGDNQLNCVSFSSRCKHGVAPVVDCRFVGGHIVKSYVPALMWEFFSKHTRDLGNTHRPTNGTMAPPKAIVFGKGGVADHSDVSGVVAAAAAL